VNDYQGDNNFAFSENGELRLARTVLPAAKLVFDVGANVGDWTEMALNINPALETHSFDPNPATFAELAAKTFPPTVHRNAFGLGETTRERELFIFDDAGGSNSLYRRVGVPAEVKRVERVSLRTVDDYCAGAGVGRIDFMKIDVEGHELSVLRGAAGMLAKGAVGVVQFEYGGAYIDSRSLLRDVYEFVGSINSGYAFYKVFPDALRPMPSYHQTFETFQYSNWVIVHRDWDKVLA
jgi:FkbM family methyltransferase